MAKRRTRAMAGAWHEHWSFWRQVQPASYDATGTTGASATDAATPPHETGARAPPNAIRIFVDGGFVAVRIATELRAAGIGRRGRRSKE